MSSAAPDHLVAVFTRAAMEVLGQLPATVTPETPIAELDIDSLALLEITMVIEEELDVEVASEEFQGVESVGDALAVFERALARP